MHCRALFVNHLGAASGDVIHHPADRPPVARDRAGGKDDHVVGLEPHVMVVISRDPRERRTSLPLRAGRHTDHVPGGTGLDLGIPDL